MKNLALEDALKTYQETIQLPTSLWSGWVMCVHTSLQHGIYHGGEAFPSFVKDVYTHLLTDKTTSHADTN